MSDNNKFTLSDCVSKFDDSFVCKVTGLEIHEYEIRVFIDVKGPGNDYLMPPQESILYNSDTNYQLPFLRQEFSLEDSLNGYLGFLAYDRTKVVPGTYMFQYSSWNAWSSAMVFTFDGNSFSS